MSRHRRRFDKLAFFDDLGYVPHDGQLEIHLDDHPRRIVACGVRWGKTVCAAMEGLAAAMEPQERSYGWVVAPTYDLANKVFREILRLAREHLNHHIDGGWQHCWKFLQQQHGCSSYTSSACSNLEFACFQATRFRAQISLGLLTQLEERDHETHEPDARSDTHEGADAKHDHLLEGKRTGDTATSEPERTQHSHLPVPATHGDEDVPGDAGEGLAGG